MPQGIPDKFVGENSIVKSAAQAEGHLYPKPDPSKDAPGKVPQMQQKNTSSNSQQS